MIFFITVSLFLQKILQRKDLFKCQAVSDKISNLFNSHITKCMKFVAVGTPWYYRTFNKFENLEVLAV